MFTRPTATAGTPEARLRSGAAPASAAIRFKTPAVECPALRVFRTEAQDPDAFHRSIALVHPARQRAQMPFKAFPRGSRLHSQRGMHTAPIRARSQLDIAKNRVLVPDRQLVGPA
jgi:hypothetical protein